MPEYQEIIISSEEEGCRTDRIVRKRLALMPLSSIYMLFRKGKVLVGEKRAKQDYRLKAGDILRIVVNAAEVTPPKAADSSLVQLAGTSFFRKNFSVLYEDSDLLACNKPSGLVVHPGSGHTRHDSLIDLVTAYLLQKKRTVSGEEVALVHRIDRDTSGVILIAKNKRTLRLLHDQFRERSLTKEYLALCHGRPPENEGSLRMHLVRSDRRDSGMKMKVQSGGSEALCSYRIESYNGTFSRVVVLLETGKTHQIRVQMAEVKAPIIGDVRYGREDADRKLFGGNPAPRLFLHAHRLSLRHPHTGKSLTIKAPVPEPFSRLISG